LDYIHLSLSMLSPQLCRLLRPSRFSVLSAFHLHHLYLPEIKRKLETGNFHTEII
jgi:hypothetical protein